ncbi:MAG: nucleotidyltransferase domain-containing protein [Patescibacteria group bacterium]
MKQNNLKINQEARKIAKVVAEKYKPEKIILYGSVARGDIRKNSDIDLCIIKKTKLPFRKRIWKVYNLIRNVDYDYGLEPIIFTPNEFTNKKKCNDFFVKNILKDGKILYETKKRQ